MSCFIIKIIKQNGCYEVYTILILTESGDLKIILCSKNPIKRKIWIGKMLIEEKICQNVYITVKKYI